MTGWQNRGLGPGWNRYWFAASAPAGLALYRIVCFSVLAAIYWNWDDRGWALVSPVFWMPVSVFHAMPQPHDPQAIGAIQGIWKVSLLTSAAGFLTRVSTGTAAVLGIFVLGLPNNYGTSHHNDAFVVLIAARPRAVPLRRRLEPGRSSVPPVSLRGRT